ncbi:MAG: phospholipase D-like domain-containing protein [Lachnospiraceae bacterium]|nr:phospholipase D-like domain-containing protein [Lachnospiraceae bacterium]
MQKHKKKHCRKWLFALFALLVFYIGAFTIPYIPHKTVSEKFREEFSGTEVYGDHTGPERVAYVEDNKEALLMRLRMIEEAEKELILSTFDFHSDQSGKDVMAALLHAAGRGVQVRVLIDGFSGFLSVRDDSYFLALASHDNVQLRIYNPVNFLKPWKLQARLHDKYLIVDDEMYLLGGRNTYDLFLGDYSASANIDRELFVLSRDTGTEETSLQQVKAYFEQVWALPECEDFICRKETNQVKSSMKELEGRYEELKELYPSVREQQDWQAVTMETNKITLLSNPTKACNKEPNMWYSLTQLMKTGSQVTVYTPYIICGKEMYEDLRQVCQSGVSVDIITNDVVSGANPWGCTDYMNQKQRIRDTGVQVYEYLGPHSNHTKAMVVDDRLSVVGSWNMDMRSTYQDTELMLAVDCPELNRIIRAQADEDITFSRTMADGKYQYGENYRAVELSTGKKLFYGIFRIFTIFVRRFL